MIDLRLGDSMGVLKTLPDASVDSVITDPPAGISFMGKGWDSDRGGRDAWIEWLSAILSECYRVAKPGAMLLCWSLPRTSHWTGMAIERAGWEPRDVISHLFATGFPKSASLSKSIDKAADVERPVVGIAKGAASSKTNSLGVYNPEYPDTLPATEAAELWDGWGTALKPAAEFWWLAMKPIDGTFAENAIRHGVAGLNIDGARIPTDEVITNHSRSAESAVSKGKYGDSKAQETHQTPGQSSGRWPSNVILDCSCEGDTHDADCPVAILDAQSGVSGGGQYSGVVKRPRLKSWHSQDGRTTVNSLESSANAPDNYGDSGGASRFFYVAKASKSERNEGLDAMPERNRDASRNAEQPSMNGGEGNPYNRGAKPVTNFHPTVKSVALMEYLCKLTKTPTGGVVLDPFMGSGSTGIAAIRTGRDFIGIELDPDYFEIARRRIEHESGKAKQPTLFGG